MSGYNDEAKVCGSRGWKARQAGKPPTQDLGRGCLKGPCLTLLVSRRSLRDGSRGRSPDLRISLLTNTSQPSYGQWRVLLVFVPAYSGASVRELHPLPESITSRAKILLYCRIIITWLSTCQV